MLQQEEAAEVEEKETMYIVAWNEFVKEELVEEENFQQVANKFVSFIFKKENAKIEKKNCKE